MYAPFGTGVLIGPRATFSDGDPFLAGGGAVDLVDLDEVVWTDPPEREEAGSPNVIGAVALHAAIDELDRDRLGRHRRARATRSADRLRDGLAAIAGVRLLGPALDGRRPSPWRRSWSTACPTPLVAARLSAEYAIGVRHGCFCAHPYLLRLLGLDADEIARYRGDVLRGDRRDIPGAVRASAGLSTTEADVDRFLDAVAVIAGGDPPPVAYDQDPATGDFWPRTADPDWADAARRPGTSCARG